MAVLWCLWPGRLSSGAAVSGSDSSRAGGSLVRRAASQGPEVWVVWVACHVSHFSSPLTLSSPTHPGAEGAPTSQVLPYSSDDSYPVCQMVCMTPLEWLFHLKPITTDGRQV